MSKRKTTYTIFLSAPSDVSADVELVKQVISDLNILFHSMGLEFESFHWLDNVTPGATSDAQGRINMQAKGYDIIVALLGGRLGTPTEKYESGTVEEIEISLSSVGDREFGDDSVIVAFKNVTLDTSTGDLTEASKVQAYRKKLSGRVLYKEYEDDSDLRNVILRALSPILHKHILFNANETGKSLTNNPQSAVPLVSSYIESDESDDEDNGIIDLVVLSEKSFTSATQSLNNITESVSIVGSTMEAITREMSEGDKSGDILFMAKAMTDVSKTMNNAADVVERESESMLISFNSAIGNVERVLEISHEDFPDQEPDVSGLSDSLEMLYVNITSGLEPVSIFRNTLLELPKIDKGLNRAKIRLMKSLDMLDVSMRAILDRTSEVRARIGQ